MYQVKILIVEDESLVAMDMADMLTNLGYKVLPAAYNYADAVEMLNNEMPDLVLADIDLGEGKSGIELAQLVRRKYNLPFIFITSHSDKATVSNAAATAPNGYLVKPFSEEDLFSSIEVALANFNEGRRNQALVKDTVAIPDTIFVKTDTNYVKVIIADIQWLESDHNYLYIVTHGAKHIVRSSFRDFMENLPAGKFMQVHKSFIVNLQKIDSVSHTEIVINKTPIPLSRNYKDELFDKIKRVQ